MTGQALRSSVAVGAIAVVAIVAVVLAGGGGAATHNLRASFASATNLVDGQAVRVADQTVGEVGSISYEDGRALVEIEIEDDRVWPLTQGTTAAIRGETTLSINGRYVDLRPGPEAAPELPDGGVIPPSDVITPVEFDQVFNIFDEKTRGSLAVLLENSGMALDGRAGQLREGLQEAPGGFGAIEEVLEQLGDDPAAMRTLVAAGHETAAAIADRDSDLRETLDAAGATFDAVAAEADGVREGIEKLPETLRAGRGTLSRASESLSLAQELVDDARTGVGRLRKIAEPARRTLEKLHDVAPLATSTLQRGAEASPGLTRFLAEAEPITDRLDSVFDQSTSALECIRPYAPEIAGWASNWAAFGKNYDDINHYWRTLVLVPPFPNTTPASSDALVGMVPGLSYAFPRPAGLTEGQTWFQPQCAAGLESLDAASDPEAQPRLGSDKRKQAKGKRSKGRQRSGGEKR